jgi:hypothetical protein
MLAHSGWDSDKVGVFASVEELWMQRLVSEDLASGNVGLCYESCRNLLTYRCNLRRSAPPGFAACSQQNSAGFC